MRLHLINQSGAPVEEKFAGYDLNLTAGGDMLLAQPVGDYLAPGVHFLPLGPELWLKAAEG